MHKLIDPAGRVLYIESDKEALAILAGRQPLPKPKPPTALQQLLCLVALGVLVTLMLLLFVLMGEDKAEPYSPESPEPPMLQPAPISLPWQA